MTMMLEAGSRERSLRALVSFSGLLRTLYPGSLYSVLMARGWESKSVEEQVEQQRSSEPAKVGKLTPDQATRERARAALELQRERVLDERTSNPIRRKALEAALAEIEAKLAAL